MIMNAGWSAATDLIHSAIFFGFWMLGTPNGPYKSQWPQKIWSFAEDLPPGSTSTVTQYTVLISANDTLLSTRELRSLQHTVPRIDKKTSLANPTL